MTNALVSGDHPSGPVLPALIAGAGERPAWRFVEFFTVNIRNDKHRVVLNTQPELAILRNQQTHGRQAGYPEKC